MNYNVTFGCRKLNHPSRRKRFRFVLIVVLLLMLAGGVFVFFFLEGSGKDAVKPAGQVQEPPAAAGLAAVPDKRPEPVAEAATVERVQASLSSPTVNRLLDQAESAFNAGEYVAARKFAEQALSHCKNRRLAEWRRAATILGNANIKIFTTDCAFPEKKERYTVAAGDALQIIARRFNTTVEAIQRSNGLKSYQSNIWEGQTLVIYRGDWNIRVSKQDFQLYVYDGSQLFKFYDIGIGRQGRTPTGNFMITSKISEPDWYSPQGKIPYGSKDNVLGTRWLELRPTDPENSNLRGYGIHGTWERDSIGQERSNGCIRMLNEDVEELFSFIPLRTVVVIED